MKLNHCISKQLHGLFSYYPEDLIEAALLSLMPASTNEIDEHSTIKHLFYAELNEIIMQNLTAYQQIKDNEPLGLSENMALANAHAIIHLLRPIIPVGYIFFQQGKLDHGSLTIVMDQYQYKPTDEVQAMVNFSLMDYPNISCVVHAHSQIVDLIKHGNVYYSLLCTPVNLIYQHPIIYNLPVPDPNILAQHKLNSIQVFKQYSQRAHHFFEGAERFIYHKAYTMAAFMLQQACEFTYKGLVLALRGKDLKTHDLVALRKHALHHVPAIVGLFHSKPKKEIRLLASLQEAYVKTRYDDHYEVESQQSILYRDATANLIKEVHNLFNQYMGLSKSSSRV